MSDTGTSAIGTSADELATRIKKLEDATLSAQKRSYLGAIAGVVGTILSLATGTLTIYDGTVRKAQEDRQTLYTQFSARVDELIADNQKLMTLSIAKEDQPGSRMAAQSTVNAAKFYTLNAARGMLPKIEKMVTAPQFVLLATETAQTGDINAARDYMERAEQLSDGPMKPEVLRMAGRMFMMSNDPVDRNKALTAFAQAAELAEPNTTWGSSMNKATILHDWILALAIVGNCRDAAGLIPRMAGVLAKTDMSAEGRTYVKNDLRLMLAQQPQCKVDTGKLGP